MRIYLHEAIVLMIAGTGAARGSGEIEASSGTLKRLLPFELGFTGQRTIPRPVARRTTLMVEIECDVSVVALVSDAV
jgi:hypothetical protein